MVSSLLSMKSSAGLEEPVNGSEVKYRGAFSSSLQKSVAFVNQRIRLIL